jgi:phosphoesterase RecJ-like protein
MENINELKGLLNIPKDIVIVSHRNPDGDAIGSSLALFHYLNQYGHAIKMIVPSEYPDAFAWMSKVEDIIIYDSEQETSEELISKAELIFCLDFNSLDRIDRVGELIAANTQCKVAMIDHHLYPEPFSDFPMSDTSASSTCEMIYDFISLLDDKSGLNKTIGECMFAGILTDTGSFKYSTSPTLFRIVAELLELGVDDYILQDLIFNTRKEKELRLLGYCLYNRMEVLPEHNAALITLTKEDYTNFDIKRGDTEGVVNFLLTMQNINIAAFISEQPKIVKISLRSKGDISVQQIATKYFKGGGHKNAAGGFAYNTLNTTVKRFKEALAEREHSNNLKPY